MTDELPFGLTLDTSTQWIESLTQLNCVNSANQLNTVVKKFRYPNDCSNEFKALVQFSPYILEITSTIESSLLSQSENSSSTKSRKIERLCIQLLRNTGLAFYAQATSNETQEEKEIAIYMAVQFIGYCQRSSAIAHESPSLSLWRNIAELYKQTQESNSFHREIENSIPQFTNQTSIEDVFKRNLLFAILEPYKYSRDDTKELFKLSNEQAQLISLNREYSDDNCFQWDSNDEVPPWAQNYNQHNIDFDINIETNGFLDYIESADFSYALDEMTISNLVNLLSSYKKIINSPTPSIPVINNFIAGFENILNFLEKSNKLNKIEQLSSELANSDNTEKNAFSFVETNTPFKPPQSGFTTSKSCSALLKDTKAIKVIQTKSKIHLIAETNPINCGIGDIVLLCNTALEMQIGLIRQIKITNQSGTMHILIECIDGSPVFHQCQTRNATEKSVILIQKETSNDPELFITPCKLSNGTQLTSSNQMFTLDELIDYSPSFMHYSITVS